MALPQDIHRTRGKELLISAMNHERIQQIKPVGAEDHVVN